MRVLALIAAVAIFFGGCGSRSGSATTTTGTGASASGGAGGPTSLDSLMSRCGPVPSARYLLGGGGAGGITQGNPDPVIIDVTTGSRFAVWGHFADRHLGPVQVTGTGLDDLCNVDTNGSGGGPAAIFEARSPGVVTISTSTDDCAACAGFTLVARVTVAGA